jgi:hypothetical protein
MSPEETELKIARTAARRFGEGLARSRVLLARYRARLLALRAARTKRVRASGG